MSAELSGDQQWRALLDGEYGWDKDRKFFARFPGKRRCKNCNAPLDGIGAWAVRFLGRRPFRRNPRFCDF